ncbi:hypothetical protein CYMTET_15510 [Cymbomonas tetramitiformis]|uniref:Fibrinogen C-terminal domain-containing protein n=1 Tax=Cymbomonas tetramitiformis TaxID=36881 RepID=A0AAE0GE22_9CHLO|nr:hypothetical protein CYMTET_15510 [Cymbomonas tetramitiformis]
MRATYKTGNDNRSKRHRRDALSSSAPFFLVLSFAVLCHLQTALAHSPLKGAPPQSPGTGTPPTRTQHAAAEMQNTDAYPTRTVSPSTAGEDGAAASGQREASRMPDSAVTSTNGAYSSLSAPEEWKDTHMKMEPAPLVVSTEQSVYESAAHPEQPSDSAVQGARVVDAATSKAIWDMAMRTASWAEAAVGEMLQAGARPLDMDDKGVAGRGETSITDQRASARQRHLARSVLTLAEAVVDRLAAIAADPARWLLAPAPDMERRRLGQEPAWTNPWGDEPASAAVTSKYADAVGDIQGRRDDHGIWETRGPASSTARAKVGSASTQATRRETTTSSVPGADGTLQCDCASCFDYVGQSCHHIRDTCVALRLPADDGIYQIRPGGTTTPISQVRCDMANGGWTVFQRRSDGLEDFFRTWAEYKSGFGELNGDFWAGNDLLHSMTSAAPAKLRVDLQYGGQAYHAEYLTFEVGDESSQYLLRVGGHVGPLCDALHNNEQWPHDGQMFSTKDRENDKHPGHCAIMFHGAFWYGDCHRTNLNGMWGSTQYGTGLNWLCLTGYHASATFTEMKTMPHTPLTTRAECANSCDLSAQLPPVPPPVPLSDDGLGIFYGLGDTLYYGLDAFYGLPDARAREEGTPWHQRVSASSGTSSPSDHSGVDNDGFISGFGSTASATTAAATRQERRLREGLLPASAPDLAGGPESKDDRRRSGDAPTLLSDAQQDHAQLFPAVAPVDVPVQALALDPTDDVTTEDAEISTNGAPLAQSGALRSEAGSAVHHHGEGRSQGRKRSKAREQREAAAAAAMAKSVPASPFKELFEGLGGHRTVPPSASHTIVPPSKSSDRAAAASESYSVEDRARRLVVQAEKLADAMADVGRQSWVPPVGEPPEWESLYRGAFATSGSRSAALYYPFGVQREVPEAVVASGGWELCYDGREGPAMTAGQYYFANCQGEHVLLAMRGDRDDAPDTLQLLAAGRRVEVLRETYSEDEAYAHNGAFWYNLRGRSVGFAPAAVVTLRPTDLRRGFSRCEARLSWRAALLGGALPGGRAGCATWSGQDGEWRKVAYHHVGDGVHLPVEAAPPGLSTKGSDDGLVSPRASSSGSFLRAVSSSGNTFTDNALYPEYWLNPHTAYAQTYAANAVTGSIYRIVFGSVGAGTVSVSGDSNLYGERLGPRFMHTLSAPADVTALVDKTYSCSDHFFVFSTSRDPGQWRWGSSGNQVKFVWDCNGFMIYSTSSSSYDWNSCLSAYTQHRVHITMTSTTATFRNVHCGRTSSAPHSLGAGPWYFFIGADDDSQRVSVFNSLQITGDQGILPRGAPANATTNATAPSVPLTPAVDFYGFYGFYGLAPPASSTTTTVDGLGAFYGLSDQYVASVSSSMPPPPPSPRPSTPFVSDSPCPSECLMGRVVQHYGSQQPRWLSPVQIYSRGPAAFDLHHSTLLLSPTPHDEEGSGYRMCLRRREGCRGLPDPPSVDALRANLSDDSWHVVELHRAFPFFHEARSEVAIGSNGELVFDRPPQAEHKGIDLAHHFAQPRIAALYADLNPARGGEVRFETLEAGTPSERLVVTWGGVPEYFDAGANHFQAALYPATGEIRLSWADVTATQALVGVSGGPGASGGASEAMVDFSRDATTCGIIGAAAGPEYVDLTLRSFSGGGGEDAVGLPAVAAAGNAVRSILLRLRTTAAEDYCAVSTGAAAENRSFSVVSYGSEGRCVGVLGYLNDFHPGYRGYPAHCTPVNDGAWHHVAVTYDGEGTLRVYVDGLEDNRAEGKAYGTAGQENFLGRSHDVEYPDPFVGEVHGVAFYDRALSGAEVAAAAAQGNQSGALEVSLGPCVEGDGGGTDTDENEVLWYQFYGLFGIAEVVHGVNSVRFDEEGALPWPPAAADDFLSFQDVRGAAPDGGVDHAFYPPGASTLPPPQRSPRGAPAPPSSAPPPQLTLGVHHLDAPPWWREQGLPHPPVPALARVQVLPMGSLPAVTLRPGESYLQEIEIINSGDRSVQIAAHVEAWTVLLERVEASGARGSAALLPLAQGRYRQVAAVWRGGWWGCGEAAACGHPVSPGWPWQACMRNCDGVRRPFSFELLKNGEHVLEQPAWGALPLQCATPVNGTDDIICDVDLVIDEGDTLTITWYEVSHGASRSPPPAVDADDVEPRGMLLLDLLAVAVDPIPSQTVTNLPASSPTSSLLDGLIFYGGNFEANDSVDGVDQSGDRDQSSPGSSVNGVLDLGKSSPTSEAMVSREVAAGARELILLNHTTSPDNHGAPLPMTRHFTIRIVPTGDSRADVVAGLPSAVHVDQHVVNASCGIGAGDVEAASAGAALDASMRITAFVDDSSSLPPGAQQVGGIDWGGDTQGVHFHLEVSFSTMLGIDAAGLVALLEVMNGRVLESHESPICKGLQTDVVGLVHLENPWAQNYTLVRVEMPDVQAETEAVYAHRPVAELFAMDMLATGRGHCTDKTQALMIVMFSEPVAELNVSALEFGAGVRLLTAKAISGMNSSYHVHVGLNASFTGQTYVRLRPDVVMDHSGAANLPTAKLEFTRFRNLPMSQFASYRLNASNPYMRVP